MSEVEMIPVETAVLKVVDFLLAVLGEVLGVVVLVDAF